MKNLNFISVLRAYVFFLSPILFITCTNSDGTLIGLPQGEDGSTPQFFAEATVAEEVIKQTAGIGGISLKSEVAKTVLGIEDITKGVSISNVIETNIGDFVFSFYTHDQLSAKYMLAQPKRYYAEDRDGKLSYSINAIYEDLNFSTLGVARPDSLFWYMNGKLVNKGSFLTHPELYYKGENYPQSIALETSYQSDYTQKLRQTRYNALGNSNINGNVRVFTLPPTGSKVLGLSVTQSNIGFNWDNFVITSTFPLDPKEVGKTHCVTVSDNRNSATSASSCVTTLTPSNNTDALKAPNFLMISQELLKGDFWSRVAISYRYKDGFTYRSDLQPQPSTSNYDILETKDETPIDNNNKTVRSYLIRFNCMLYNVEGKKL